MKNSSSFRCHLHEQRDIFSPLDSELVSAHYAKSEIMTRILIKFNLILIQHGDRGREIGE